MVLPPILDNFFKSDNEAIPVINDVKTNGIAINFNNRINIVPNGAIQSVVN